MKVWVIEATRKDWPGDITREGIFVSDYYVLNDSFWSSAPWQPNSDGYMADYLGWKMHLFEVEVEGSNE